MADLPLKDFNLILKTRNPTEKINFQWSIRNVNKLPGRISSSKFSLISGKPREWDVCIELAPDGKLQASLAYHAQENAVPIEVESISRIMSNKGKMLQRDHRSTHLFYGGDQHPLLAPDKYLVSEDGMLVLHCSMTVQGHDLGCSRNLYNEGDDRDIELLQKDYLRMLIAGHYSDLRLDIGERSISAHKCVLKSLSPKFYRIHREDFDKRKITVDHMAYHGWRIALRSIYSMKIEQIDRKDFIRNLVDFYGLASHYEMRYLYRESIRAIVYNIDINDVCLYYTRAERDKDEIMLKFLESFIKDHLSDLENDLFYNQMAATRPHLPKPNGWTMIG